MVGTLDHGYGYSRSQMAGTLDYIIYLSTVFSSIGGYSGTHFYKN